MLQERAAGASSLLGTAFRLSRISHINFSNGKTSPEGGGGGDWTKRAEKWPAIG